MDNNIEDINRQNRRNLLKAFAAAPLLGFMTYGAIKKINFEKDINEEVLKVMGLDLEPVSRNQAIVKVIEKREPHLRIGIIGSGGRGRALLKAAGFLSPEELDGWRKSAEQNPNDNRYTDFIAQEDLNVSITAVCDVFDEHARLALEAASNPKKLGKSDFKGITAKRYTNYRDLLADKDIDAVIIATPDHWHGPMSIEAAMSGKHVYVEKPMTHNVEETFALREAIRKNNVVFQLGHQGRQTDSYIKAEEILRKNVLGKINLIEVATNRNSPNGAWVYDIHPNANPSTIDWKQFLGSAPEVPFDLKRFFRWRCWWDYGTGLSGDLLTHEYDAINQVMKLGIPYSCVASGGVYFYKDGREVPDVFQAVFEYPKRDLTFMYTASLASNRPRGKVFMGHDGHMEMDATTTVYIDRESTRYRDIIERGLINPDEPAFVFSSSGGKVDALTSPTAKYFAKRGLLYTYRDGKRMDTTFLHVKEWISCIREKVQPSCDIDQGFEEAITAHMATIALREGIKVYWDSDKEKIIKGEKA